MAANAALSATASATTANGTVSSTPAPARVQAEVCTVDAAQQLGFNGDRLRNLFTANNDKMELYFNSCKNYGNPLEKSQKKLCSQRTNDSNEYKMNCTAATNGTVGFKRIADTCKTVSCPPGFKRNQTTDLCETEPTFKDYWRDKRAFCQERWYDWFTVENYHLGNNYSNTEVQIMEEKKVEGGDVLKVLASNLVSCYSPCPTGKVPLYRRDPVDSDTMGDEIDKIDQCVSKTDYFTAKYKNTDDYCPLAAIHAITLSKANIESRIREQRDSVRNNTEFNPITSAVNELNSTISKDVEYISAQAVKAANNVMINPKCVSGNGCGNEYNARACSALESDPKRVEYAYQQCDILTNYSPNTKRDTLIGNEADYADKYLAHLGPTDRTKHLRNLKRSCNALFADPSKSTASDAYPAAAENPISFTAIDQTEVGDAIEDPYDPQFDQEPFEIMNRLPGSIKMGLLLAILPFVAWVLYLALGNVLIVLRWLRWTALRPAYKWFFNKADSVFRWPLSFVGILDSHTIVAPVTNIELKIGHTQDEIFFTEREIAGARDMITKLTAKLEKLKLAAPEAGK
jgi:hypothetical protein